MSKESQIALLIIFCISFGLNIILLAKNSEVETLDACYTDIEYMNAIITNKTAYENCKHGLDAFTAPLVERANE